MKKVKEKFEDVFDAFFNQLDSTGEQSLDFAFEYTIAEIEEESGFREKIRSFFSLLRRGILYLPGTIVLHFLSSALTWIWFAQPRFPGKPQYGFIFLFALAAIIMTTIGLGDIRKRKHLAIPGSIALIGFLTGLTAFLFTNLQPPLGLETYFAYFLPIALAAPFLAKYLIDGTEKED